MQQIEYKHIANVKGFNGIKMAKLWTYYHLQFIGLWVFEAYGGKSL